MNISTSNTPLLQPIRLATRPPTPWPSLRASGLHPEISVGTLVGAQRWPYQAAHPDCWLEPITGVVLHQADPRAWARTIAFSSDAPPAPLVNSHVRFLLAAGLLQDSIPVLWAFPRGHVAYWHHVAQLAPAELDRRRWLQARESAYARHKPAKLSLVA